MDKSFFKKITESLKRFLMSSLPSDQMVHRGMFEHFFSNKHLFDLRSQDSQRQGPRECLGETDDDL